MAKENQLLSLEHPCWLSLVQYANVIKRSYEVTCQIDFFRKDRNILGGWRCAETVSRILIISYYVNIANIRYSIIQWKKYH